MSQNNNDESTMIAMGLAFIGVAAMALAFVFAAIIAFAAFLFTILAILAWSKPLRLGRLVIEPEEAQAFVYRGLIGAVSVPAFLLFCAIVFDLRIEWNYLFHFMLAGYVLGSVGVEIAMAEENGSSRAVHPQQSHQVLPPQPAQRALPPAAREPFRYASWDDEEENRR